jgi:transglutaminase-like putative cysteine protease
LPGHVFAQCQVRAVTILSVRHVTTYRYKRPVSFGEHRIMFRPRDSYDQRLIRAGIEITPHQGSLRWIHDVFGNCVALARFTSPASELRFETNITLDHVPANTPDFQMEDYARTYPFTYSSEEMPDLMRLVEPQFLDPDRRLHHWVQRFVKRGTINSTSELLMTVTYGIKESLAYERRSEKGTQDPITTLSRGRGTCRDFAVLMMEAARCLGFAARFVSGYIYSPAGSDESYLGGGSTHAWCQVYLPGAGWVEFDPTNGIIGNRDLIRIAVARDPRQAIPLSGTWVGKPDDSLGMTVEVSVREEEALRRAGPL